GKRHSVGSWLYKVAYRVACAAQARRRKEVAQGQRLDEMPAPEQADALVWRDLRPVLDDEVSRLPEKYRVPFVLCYLEGKTNEEAARYLGCPRGTVLSRLARARERLRGRLPRRGLALSSAAPTTALSEAPAPAA